MKIVVLDSVPANPGDLDWEPFEQFGELVVYDASSPDDVPARVADADVVITNKCRLTADIIDRARSLTLICEMATGYDNIDVTAAKSRGITVVNVPAYSTDSTAQTAIALLLELTQRVGAHSDSVRAGDWTASQTFCYWKYPLVELAEKTMLIVGLGHIGSKVSAIATALGMRVVAAQLPGRSSTEGHYPRIPIDEALSGADVVSLHCPLTPVTTGLINAARLAMMKPSAFIVNCARGSVVVERDVADALAARKLAGYAADVLSVEPPPADNPLLGAPNCIITPHLGWATRESRRRLLDTTCHNIRTFLDGSPQNVV